MALKIDGSRAQVHWLTDKSTAGKITSDLGLLYVVGDKLGQATADSYAGLTPAEVFERRYNGQKSSLKEDFVASDLIVFNKIHGTDYKYDDRARELIYDLGRKGRITFSANYNRVQSENTNNEAMIGFDREEHLDDLIRTVAQSLGIDHFYDTKDPIFWRWQQYEDAQEILSKLQSHQLCLYAAYTGRGKTKISMEVATQLCQQGGVVLVTTPITDTKDSFRENINDFHFGNDRSLRTTYMDAGEFATTTVGDIRARAANGELIFVVLTVQDLRYGDAATKNVRKKYAALSGNIDLWIRDERHAQYEGEVTAERLADVTAQYELDLTATPYNVLDRYHEDHIVSRTLLWGLVNRAHTKLPEIQMAAISTPVANISSRIAGIYSTEEGFDPRKLFVRENGNFVMIAEIETLADRFYHSTLSQRKNVLTIANDTAISNTAKQCGMWVLPQGQDGDGASEYIPALAEALNRRFQYQGTIYVDSYTLERAKPANMTIGAYVEYLCQEYPRVVILTCGKFLTGTDIRPLGHIVLFDKIGNTANFEQLMGRMIREWPGKDRVKMYSLVPGHELRITLGQMARSNAALGGGSEWDVLDCIPFTEYTETGVRAVTPSEILENLQEFCREQLRANLPSVSLRNALSQIDLSAWDEVDTREYRRTAPTTDITEDTGAKVRERVSDPTKRMTRQQLTKIEDIRDTIRSVMAEAQWVAYSIDDYDYRVVFAQEPMIQIFKIETIAAVLDSIAQSSEVENMVRTFLLERQTIYQNLDPEEIYSEIFVNNDLKSDAGLVYVDFNLAKEVVDFI